MSMPAMTTTENGNAEATTQSPDFPFAVYILIFEGVEEEPIQNIIPRLEQEFGFPVKVLDARPEVDPEWLNPERNQYPALRVLEESLAYAPENSARLLAFFSGDMYIAQTEFVFGLADPGSRGAVVSQFRLLSGEKQRQQARLANEALHELGHTFGLTHCPQVNKCVMSVARTVRAVDARSASFEPACRKKLNQAIAELKAELIEKQTRKTENNNNRDK
jgi:archaemetzincin